MGAIITVSAILIGLFLLLKYSKDSESVLGAFGKQFTSIISTLQGPH